MLRTNVILVQGERRTLHHVMTEDETRQILAAMGNSITALGITTLFSEGDDVVRQKIIRLIAAQKALALVFALLATSKEANFSVVLQDVNEKTQLQNEYILF